MVRTTAIWNQDSILELLTRELDRSARERGDLCVMLAGMDRPANYNQEQQVQSEAILGEIAKRFTAVLRTYDHIGRYGSDQLLIVIPGSSLASVIPVAEKLRQAVEQSPLEVGSNRFPVTVSVALADAASRNEPEVLRELGGLLQQAQTKGGNRVESAKKLPLVSPSFAPKRPNRLSLWIGSALLAAFALLCFLVPSTICAPFLLRDILDSSELPPQLPADCALTTEHPSEATMRTLDSQRDSRRLQLEGTVTCKIKSSGPKDHSIQIDQQWLDSIYVNGTLQDKRHVLIAATEKVPGGVLFTVEQCVMPWWDYFRQPQDRCWEQAEFWK
jgi:diguanylate cyclase (GGDEF)-like protein